MSNDGNKELYGQIVRIFDELSSGNHPSELEHMVSKAHRLFSGGYTPSEYPSSDFGAKTVKSLAEYGNLIHQRKKISVEGAEREVTTEHEAYRSLVLASRLADNLILPNFESKTEFTNKVFNDIYNRQWKRLDNLRPLSHVINLVRETRRQRPMLFRP